MMSRYLILYLIFVSLATTGNGQTIEIIENGGFEERKAITAADKPDGDSQIGLAARWQEVGHSPDWISTKSGFYNTCYALDGEADLDCTLGGVPMTTGDGSQHYAGFGPCEGLVQKFNFDLPENAWFKLSFDYALRYDQEAEIHAYFLNFDPGNISAICEDPGIIIRENSHFSVAMDASGADATHEQGTWYHYESDWTRVGSSWFDRILFKGRDVEGTITSEEYVYMDNISVELMPKCAHACVPSIGGTPTVNFPYAFYYFDPYYFEFENIQGYDLYITRATYQAPTDAWVADYIGAADYFFHREEENLNGLMDDNGLWKVRWRGDSRDLFWLAPGIYHVHVRMWNCSETVELNSMELQIVENDGSEFSPPMEHAYPNDIPVLDQQDCCIPNKVLSQALQYSEANYTVDEYIEGRLNYNISAGDEISFRAGDEIRLLDGFASKEGSSFSALIEDCNVPWNARKHQSIPLQDASLELLAQFDWRNEINLVNETRSEDDISNSQLQQKKEEHALEIEEESIKLTDSPRKYQYVNRLSS